MSLWRVHCFKKYFTSCMSACCLENWLWKLFSAFRWVNTLNIENTRLVLNIAEVYPTSCGNLKSRGLPSDFRFSGRAG